MTWNGTRMKSYLLILPVAALVGYSQLIVKWRASSASVAVPPGFLPRLLAFLSDPILLSAYAAALVASFAWLFVVSRLPLATAFPSYIGVTFLMVLFGSRIFLGEPLGTAKVLSALLILAGILIGMSTNA
jgi:multidrug transporter EmrE-like cation transporter